MSFKKLVRNLMTRSFRIRKPATIRKRMNPLGRPIESLEDRTVPTTVNLTGGGPSTWIIEDNAITTNGLPAGGTCTSGPNGSGAGINDASFNGQNDAFDFASLMWVNNIQVGGALSQTGNTVNFAPVSIAGLNVSQQFYVASASGTMRVFLTLTNPTGSPITVPVDYDMNSGADGGTVVKLTSSGDATFTATDRWIVTERVSGLPP